MRIGVFDCPVDLSVKVYIENILRELEQLGVSTSRFVAKDSLPPAADIYWDPRLTGGTPPWWKLRDTTKPIVVTAHDGASQLSIRPWEYYESVGLAMRGLWGCVKRFAYWRRWKGRCAAIITVSHFCKREIERNLLLRRERIIPIYHGVDRSVFAPGKAAGSSSPYFLHVSAYNKKKNFGRILRAIHALPVVPKPRLVAVVPRFPKADGGPGVEIIRSSLSHEELAPLYRGAIGFLFPSVHETFGMPILEAMASGCPVVTSNSTGCAEVAGAAALTIQPRSTKQLIDAMRALVERPMLRATLREAGLRRARLLSWRRSAELHLEVFQCALAAAPRVEASA